MTDGQETSLGEGAQPAVTVLLCTYNGGKYLREQLDSIAKQDWPHIDLFVSDDGSTDDTLEILKDYKWSKGDFRVLDGPRAGYVANFLSLLVREDYDAEYTAFSDQDDIWKPEKLSRAISTLRDLPKDQPALYCSRTHLVDEHNNIIGISPLFRKKPAFGNALVQSLAGGNTMVMNRAARNIMRDVGTAAVVCHDWWVYMLVTGAGGKVIYDTQPTLHYRQHGGNLIGCNHGFLAQFRRLYMVLVGCYKEWNSLNLSSLEAVEHKLTEENRRLLRRFSSMRDKSLPRRLYELFSLRLYRQTFLGQMSMYIAVLFKRF